jgi:DNA repair protein RadC
MQFGKIAKPEKSGFLFPRIGGLTDVVSVLEPFMQSRDHECLVVIHLSEEMENLQLTCHSGDETSVIGPSKKIASDALALGTRGLILAHNHPSGDPRPSASDLRFTQHLAAICEGLDVSLLDHLIFGRNEWTSLRQKGYL